MKGGSRDRVGTLAVSVVTLLVVLFSANPRGRHQGRYRRPRSPPHHTAINELRTELKAEIQGIDTRIDRHLQVHAAAAAPGSSPD